MHPQPQRRPEAAVAVAATAAAAAAAAAVPPAPVLLHRLLHALQESGRQICHHALVLCRLGPPPGHPAPAGKFVSLALLKQRFQVERELGQQAAAQQHL